MQIGSLCRYQRETSRRGDLFGISYLGENLAPPPEQVFKQELHGHENAGMWACKVLSECGISHNHIETSNAFKRDLP